MESRDDLDHRYLAFRDRTAAVFALFPQLEPLRHTIFRDFVTQPKPADIRTTVKHWIRPLLRSQRTDGPPHDTDILLWVEGRRSIIKDTLLPVFDELGRRHGRAHLVSYDGPADMPAGTTRFSYPAAARAPAWAGPAWDTLCATEPGIDRDALRQSFLYACANLNSFLTEMDQVLAALRPRVVVAASEQMTGGSALFVTARQRGIRTILLQHGIVQPFYTPLMADVMLTWGRSSSDVLERLGVAPQRLVATGSSRHDSMGRTDKPGAKQALLRELELEDKRTLVFFSNGNDVLRNGTAPRECARWLNTVAERFKRKLNVVVRLHPNEDGFLYHDCKSVILTKERPAFETLMGGCDCVASLCSTAMYEALLYGKPVWQFYADGWPELADNWRNGTAKRVASEFELTALITRMLNSERRERQGAPVRDVFANHGNAAVAVAEYLLSQVRFERVSHQRQPSSLREATKHVPL
ncbi:MAG TPA: hypothetical protein VHF07_00665 [Nitrospiraceae bacterium]|nr:hypothetical protein [Nitrospiraceae bacterium]